ncbi:transposase [Elizabethkingia anophelis]|uniref:IS982 family transposase n=1 Tax=Elizabethkingia anophelis TaxID=1117645 RepID=UPI00099AE631|nr:IS982 family transposase [Elizabethkingia anophelis]MCT3754257.1 IS982 family transposase [Elizabethkingia anophelis]MCT3989890.1 IS982 family transposase [Elizabethkingia anophelis]MCT4007478.1 IS982 family transposase [Elizabethkingia anophelis]MCT4249936.1 IS982 family transposase [Elizabethkingia anophelis]MCT4264303.1 IS982 family transposase [Elizabethkingia anophelis]
MNNLNANYERILEVLREISNENLVSYQRRAPKLKDLELISLALTAEFMGIDSESHLFRHIPVTIRQKIDRSVYNRRKRRLANKIDEIRIKLARSFNESENIFIIDSMPVEVCKLSRSGTSKICKDAEYCYPNRSFCASQKMHFYGYKLHAVCSVNGVFQSVDLSPASVHDIHYLKDIREQLSDCTLLGDKGYLSSEMQIDLFNYAHIELETPKRVNQKDYKPQFYLFKKQRKRIETLFSQLCDQFMIRRNYAKSFEGFKTRLLAKITALTVVQFINKVYFNRNINNLKVSII